MEKPGIRESSSAKIIGNNIYFLINGKSVLMPQKYLMHGGAVKRLRLNSPDKRASFYEELYMNNGIRVSVYAGDITFNQDVIVFRKYIVLSWPCGSIWKSTIPGELLTFYIVWLMLV